MKYNQPYGVSDPNAAYINGNPSTDTMGSIPPAASIEFPQREIVSVINDNGIQVPDDADLRQLSRAIQSRKTNYAQDTGLANFYACNLTPPITAYYDGLEVVLRIAHANTGPSVLNINNVGNKPVIRYDGGAFTGTELKSGMLACFRYDGVQFQHIWPATYTVGGLVYLAAPRNYYVNNATGNDSFNGLQPNAAGDGIAGPFQTCQRAFSQTAKFNLNGFAINIYVADGTYNQGHLTQMPAVNGSGQINVIGNVSNPAACNIAPTVGSGFVFGSGICTVDGFTFTTSGPDSSAPADICAAIWFAPGSGAVNNVRFNQCYGGHIVASGAGYVGVNGPITINGGISYAHMRADAGGIIALNPINKPIMNMVASPTWALAFAVSSDLSVIRGTYSQISGTALGPKFSGTSNSIFNTNGSGINYYPGSLAGAVGSGAQYI